MDKLLFIAFMLTSSVSAVSQSLKIMSYNIRHAEDMNGKVDLQQIAGVINKYKPDIVALQEVDSVTNRNGKVDQMKDLGKLTGMQQSFGRHFSYDGGAYGLGILSRFPIKNLASYRLPYYAGDPNGDTRLLLVAEIELKNKKTVRVATVHLDYKKDSMRAIQAKALLTKLNGDNSPIIIAGDFNASPDEECIGIVKSGFMQLMPQDTTYTYPSDNPTIKIDYIFLSAGDQWQMTGQHIIDERVASDHRPVVGLVRLKK